MIWDCCYRTKTFEVCGTGIYQSENKLSSLVVTCKQTATRLQFEARADTMIFIIYTTSISHHESFVASTQCGATLGNGKQNSLVSCLVHLNDLVHLCVQGTYFKFIWWNVIGQKFLKTVT